MKLSGLTLLAIMILLVPDVSLRGQHLNIQKAIPRFEDYQVEASFHGKPAEPIVPRRHAFRSRIVEGARKGPNCGGHYTIIEWGCGSGCVSFVIVDAVSGRLYYPIPFSALALPYQGTASGRDYRGLEYHLNSALLIADGCPEDSETGESGERGKNCGTRYYKWEQNRFVLIASLAAPSAPLK